MAEASFRVTRKELAAFLKDPRTIRAFELAIGNANELLPSQVEELTTLLEETSLSAETANARVNQALSSLQWIADGLAQIAMAGAGVNHAQVDELQKLADGWFPNWTAASKTAIIRSVSSDSSLTLTSTSAGAAIAASTLATTGTTVSGTITIQPGSSQNIKPGTLYLKGADTSGTNANSHGGDVEMYGGAGRRTGGDVRLFGGDASNTGAGLSLGGAFELYGGNGYKDGGGANIIGGSATGPTGNGGAAYIKPGTGSGAGSDGVAGIQDANGIDVVAVGTVALGGASALGFYGAAPVAQPVAGGAGGLGFVNGAGAAVLAGFTSTGGIGASAYDLNDIVFALKSEGLLAL